MAPTAADAPPLGGIRVVDLSSYTPGPLCAAILADLGADVVKVERPGAGDPGRTATPGAYRVLNRRKSVVELDLKAAAGRSALTELTDGADVVVEAFRSGAADRMGIGPAQLTARNPRLV
jgi:crotonobetainyl-CoA:carnitine CoA-transferase CaiB-like acyl-CoA transferase